MNVPASVRDELRDRLWKEADDLGWVNLSLYDRSRYYENWSTDPTIGGRLARYMDAQRVRIYLKDTIMGDYARTRLADAAKPLRVLDVSGDTQIVERHEKPHGVLLEDGRMIAWGKVQSWRTILLAVHERSFGDYGGSPYGVVLFRATGRYREMETRKMVEDAAGKLGIDKVRWIEG